MKFNIKDYTATKCFTVYSDNYYKCPIKADEETKEGIWKAREDWNEQGTPARKRLDVFFYGGATSKPNVLRYVPTVHR